LNAKLALHKIHQYIWYAETHAPYTTKATAEGYLGKFNETGIYFHYTPDEVTTLDDAYLMHVKEKAEQYIIYADMCLLSDKFLLKHNIIFKKIPRDISKL
jgi:adenine-specific DNA-methyltransferase